METEFAVSLGSQRWTLPADSDTITIGRGSNADIRLPSDDQISRIHARLNRSGTTWTLVDESRNGTALNGRRLAAPTPLTEGDRIQIGRSALTFHEPTEATPAPDQHHPPAAPPPSSQPNGAPSSPAGAAGAADSAGAAGLAAGTGAGAAGLAAGAPSPAAGGAASPPLPPSRADHSTPDPAHATGAAAGLAAGTAAGGAQGPATGDAASAPLPPSRSDRSTPNPASAPGATAGLAAGAAAGTPGPVADGAASPPPPPPHADRSAPNPPDSGGAASGPGLAAGGPSSAPPPSPAPRRTEPADAPGAPGAAAGGAPAVPPAPSRADRSGPSPANAGAPSEAGFAASSPSPTTHPAQNQPTARPAQAGAASAAGSPDQAAPGTPDGGQGEWADTPEAGRSAGAEGERAGWANNPDDSRAAAREEWADGPDAGRSAGAEGGHEEWADGPDAGPGAGPEGGRVEWAYDGRDAGGPDEVWIGVSEGAEWDGGPGAGQLAGGEGVGGEWVGGARVGWVDEDGGSAGGAAWAAYPSADNPEPARSPWSTTKRPALTQPEGGQANWAESAGWPDSAFEQQEQASPPTRQPEPPVRRKPATEPAPPGYVRLVRVLLVAAAVLGLGLLINLVATFFADGAGGPLRWLVPPAIALIAAMVVALIDGFSSENRPAGGRLDVPVIVAIVVVLLGVGVGGFALTAGVEYFAGYITGKESGQDRLIKPVAKTTAGLTVTVENVTYTSHFTRVEVAVSNGGDQTLSLPLEGQAAFTGEDGNSLKPDGFRSQWTDSIAAGSVERGTITFTGHLPEGLTVATLTLKSGDAPIAVPGLALSN